MNFESRKCEFELAYVIVVIFGINHVFMILDDHFKSIQGVMNVYMEWL